MLRGDTDRFCAVGGIEFSEDAADMQAQLLLC